MSDPLEAVTSELLKIQLEGLRRENSDLRNQVLAKPAMPSIAPQAPENGSWSDFVAKTEAELASKDAAIKLLTDENTSVTESLATSQEIREELRGVIRNLERTVRDLDASASAWSDRSNSFEDQLTKATAANALLERDKASLNDETDRLRSDVKRLDQAEDEALELLEKARDEAADLRGLLDNRQEQGEAPIATTIQMEQLRAALEMAGKENQLRRQMIAELQVQLARQPVPFAYPGVELVGFTVESIPFIDVRLTYDLGQTWSTILQVNAGDVRFVPRATARDIEIIMSAFQVDESDAFVADEATAEAA